MYGTPESMMCTNTRDEANLPWGLSLFLKYLDKMNRAYG